MVELSIIIPYYKTYELTRKLLQELLMQINSFKVEVIIIDDGCNETRFDEYVNWLDRKGFTYNNYIHIIHKENGGVSSARNAGLDLAKGKYIAFVDSDDMVMPNYIETLLNLIDTRNKDIIYFNWLDINTNDLVRHPSNPAVWKAIYKKEILPKFDETLKAREDYFFNQELDKQEHTKYYHDKVLYIYNSNREDSLTQRNARGEL